MDGHARSLPARRRSHKRAEVASRGTLTAREVALCGTTRWALYVRAHLSFPEYHRSLAAASRDGQRQPSPDPQQECGGFRYGLGIRRLEFVPVPDVEVGHVDRSIGVEIAQAPCRRGGELVAIPKVEVRDIDRAVEVGISREVRIPAGKVCGSGVRQPLVLVIDVDLTVASHVERRVVGTGNDFGNKQVNVGQVTRAISIEVASDGRGDNCQAAVHQEIRSIPTPVHCRGWAAQSH